MLDLKFNSSVLGSFKKNTFCQTYHFQDKNKPKLGHLFLVVEIEIDPTEGKKIAEIISEIANREYFRQGEEIAQNFELTLNKINQALATLAETGHITWVNKLHAVIAAISDNQIHLASTGKAKLSLIREEKIINVTQETTGQTQTPIKVFNNIINGSLNKGDKLIFGSPVLYNYFSEEKIKKLVKEVELERLEQKLKEDLLLDEDEISPLGVILVHITSKLKEPSSKTKEVTIPSYPELKELETKPGISFKKGKISVEKKLDLKNIKRTIALNLENWTKKLLTKVKSESSRERTYKDIKQKLPQFKLSPQQIENLKKSKFYRKLIEIKNYLGLKFKQLPRTSQIFLITSIILGLAFLISIGTLCTKRQEHQINVQYEKWLTEATQKEKTASDALIYQDFNKARVLLLEAKKIIEENNILSSENHKEAGKNLLFKIQEDLDKADKVIRLKEPVLLADVGLIEEMELAEIDGIEDKLYSYNPKSNSIYQLDEGNKQFVTLSQETTNFGHFQKAAINPAKNSIIFFTDNSAIVEFNITRKKLSKLDIVLQTDQKIKDIYLYHDRLYILDPLNNQIFKHIRTISGYSKGIKWIRDNEIDITKAISFTIDGSIYLLNSDGSILKFLNGRKQDFVLPELTTPLTSPTKIFTNVEYDYLYILDPQNKRVVVLDKKGKLKNQYISEKFNDLRDIYVDEKNNKMYLLSGQKVFGVVLEK